MTRSAGYLRDTLTRALTNTAIPVTAMQFSSGTSFSSSLITTHSNEPYTAVNRANPSTPARRTEKTNPVICFSSNSSSVAGITRCLLIDGGGRKSSDLLSRSSLRIDISNNLMNTLTAQIKLVCNLAERFPRCAHFKNLIISIYVSGRSRAKRSPHPARDARELPRSFFRKLIFSITLPGVTNPGPQINSVFFKFFDVSCRYVGVSLTSSKLSEGSDVGFETSGVVHSRDINTRPGHHVGARFHDK